MNLRSKKLLAFIFGLLTISLLVLAVFAGVLLKNQQVNLRHRTYDETGMAALQIRLHYEMLMGNLASVEASPIGAKTQDAVLQFNILYERLEALPSRPTYNRLLNAESLAIQGETLKTLTTMLERVDRAEDGEQTALIGLRAQLVPLRPSIERLAHQPMHIASEHRAAITEDFESMIMWFSWVILGFVISGIAFVLIILRQLKLAARRQTELETLMENLETARDAAEAGSRTKSDFLSHMSHEMRTPMNAILGFAQLMEMGELDATQTKAVSHILRSGEMLMHLIDQILELNKIITGGVIPAIGAVAPAKLVDECLALMNSISVEKGVTMIAAPPETPLEVMETDGNRLKQILINLLSNAIKYNHKGGRVTLAWAEAPENWVRFSVIDTGVGIPPGQEDNIFLPFNRLGRENQSIEGTGIGLTITNELVKVLGGDVQYESTLEKGTTFWVNLPLKHP